MNRPILGMLLALACVPILFASTTQATPQVGQKNNGLSKLEERYLQVYSSCWHAFQAQCGRNRVDDGNEDGTEPTDAQVRSSAQTMERWLNPPAPKPAAQPSVSVAAPTPAPTSVPTTSAGGCPSYMAGEASSPDAVNPSSGAAGCFQVLPSTAAAMGSACSDVNASSCVAAICASAGNAAWAASGSTPCDYIRP